MDIVGRPVEDFIVQDAKAVGPSVGSYDGREIPATIVDRFGRRYAYVGLAPRGWDGGLDPDALGPGEYVVLPGLLYRREDAKPGWLAGLWR
jgi:hypothetical protein